MGTIWERTREYLGLRQAVREGYHLSRHQSVCDRCGATVQPEKQGLHDEWHRNAEEG